MQAAVEPVVHPGLHPDRELPGDGPHPLHPPRCTQLQALPEDQGWGVLLALKVNQI